VQRGKAADGGQEHQISSFLGWKLMEITKNYLEMEKNEGLASIFDPF
jgi:hypothetical protein